MAGDWIKIELTLPEKPEVITMAAELELDEDEVVGKLLRVWIWANRQSENGNALSVSEAFLNRFTGCDMFAQAMRKVGWLAGKDGELVLPNFERHNSKSAKSRALANKRLTEHRKRKRNAKTVSSSSLLLSNSSSLKGGSGGKEKPAEIELPADLDTADFRRSFIEWQEHYKQKTRKRMTPLSITKLITKLEDMGHDRAIKAIDYSIANGYQGLFEPAGDIQGRAGSVGRSGQTDAVARREAKAAREYP